MFYWLIYLIASFWVSYLLANIFAGKLRIFIFIVLLTLLITPATIELETVSLAPALAVFFLDLFLEQNLSTRSLRPFLLSLPSIFVILGIYLFIRKRFF